MFDFEIVEELQKQLDKLQKKNPVLANAIHKKIREIILRDNITINAYKNLKYSFKDCKRAHITDNMILMFKADLKNNLIIFVSLKHRDDAYKE